MDMGQGGVDRQGNQGEGPLEVGKLMVGTPFVVVLVVGGEVVDKALGERGPDPVVVELEADTGVGIAEGEDTGTVDAGVGIAGVGIAGVVDTGVGIAGVVDTGAGIAGVVVLVGVDTGVEDTGGARPGASRPFFSGRGFPPWQGPW